MHLHPRIFSFNYIKYILRFVFQVYNIYICAADAYTLLHLIIKLGP